MPDQKIQTTSWINSFINQMQQQNAARSQMYNYNPVSRAMSSTQVAQSAVGNMLLSPHTAYAPAPLEDLSGGQSIVSRVLDIIERPLYGTANVVKNAVLEAQGKPAGEAVAALGQGISGKEKTTYKDVLEAGGVNPTVAAGLGMVGDLLLDPANLVYGPLGKGIVSGIKGVTGATKAAKLGEDFARIASENKPDFLGSSALASGDGAQSAASAVSGGKQSAPSVVDQVLGNQPRAIGIGTPEPHMTYPSGEIRPPASRQVVDDAINQVNQKVYQVGNISSPYQAITDELGKVRTEVLSKRDPAAAKAFSDRYKSILDPKDYAALQRVRSPQAFDEVAQNILSKSKPAGLTSVKDFVIAARHGEIPTEDMNSVLDAARVQNLEELSKAYEDMPIIHEPVTDAVLTEPATNPMTQTVRVAKDQAAEPKHPLQSVLDAAEVQKTLKNGVTLYPQNQGTAALNDMADIARNVRAASGQFNPREQLNDIATQLSARTFARDSEARNLGISHEVSAFDGPNQIGADNPVPVKTYKSLRMTDVHNVLGVPGIRKAFVDYKTKLTPSTVLRMAARVLDAHAAGVGELQAAQLAEDTGKYWNARSLIPFKGPRTAASVGQSTLDIAKLLAKNAGRLSDNVKVSTVIHESIVAKAAGHVANDVVGQITKDLSDATGTVAAATEDLADVGGLTKKLAQGNEEVIDAAAPVIAEDVAKIANEGDTKAAKTLKENAAIYADKKKSEYKAKNETVANAVSQGKVDAKQADVELVSTMPQDLSLSDQMDIQAATELNQIAEKKYRPFSSLFATWGRTGREVAQDAARGSSSSVTVMLRFNNSLARAMKPFSAEDQRIAFAALQSGQWPEETSTAFKATTTMKRYLEAAGADTSHMGGKEGSPLTSSLFGREYSTEDIHRAMAEQGLSKEKFLPSDETMTKLRAQDPTKSTRYWLSNSWRHVDVDNPTDFIERLFGASRNLASESAVGTHFSIKWGSSVRKPGYIRLGEELSIPEGAKSRFWQHVMKVDKAGKPIYYPKEAAEWLVNTERVVASATGFGKAKGPIAKFIQKDLDPLLSVWKTTVTVARPGFITRNFIGDTFLNFLAGAGGISGIKSYKDALQVMKAGGRLKNTTIDAIDQLLTDPSDVTAVGKWTGTVHLAGGKRTVINDRAMYTLAHQEAVLPSYHLSADVIDSKAAEMGDASILQKFSDSVSGTKYIQFMANATEETSHIPRMAQFLHHMQDSKFTARYRTVEEAAKAAANNVRKYHPDITSLSPSGQKVMRKIVPFYSWTRLTIPVILESLLTRPTTITFAPKVFYGVNQMVGGGAASPTELIPPTRLVPNFVRDTLGYVGGSATFNLGTPVEALADTFNGNIPQNLTSMLNPMIKAPIELFQGKQISGQAIPDKGEYIDQVLPIVNQLSNITGVSVSGSIANMVSGQGVIDPQRAVQTGNKNYFFNQALLNFLGGAGIANFDKSTYDALAAKQYRQGNL